LCCSDTSDGFSELGRYAGCFFRIDLRGLAGESALIDDNGDGSTAIALDTAGIGIGSICCS
jgi:hypothetical protein